MAQSVRQGKRDREVASSIPASGGSLLLCFAFVRKSIELVWSVPDCLNQG